MCFTNFVCIFLRSDSCHECVPDFEQELKGVGSNEAASSWFFLSIVGHMVIESD